MSSYNLRSIYDTTSKSRARRGAKNYMIDLYDDDSGNEDEDHVSLFGDDDRRQSNPQKKHKIFKTYFAFYKPTVEKSVNDQKQREDGFEYVTSDDDDERAIENIHYNLRFGATIISVVSLFFWIWAVKNTRAMKEGQDLGIFSFSATLLSSHLILYKTRKGPEGSMVATTSTRVIVTTSHILVFLNYCLGIVYAFNVGNHVYVGFATYCIIFSFFWFYVAIRGYSLLSILREYEVELQEVEDDEDLYLYNRGLGLT